MQESSMRVIETPRRIHSINPATLEVNGEVDIWTGYAVQDAVSMGWKSFPTWSSLTFSQRRDYLLRAMDIIRTRADDIARAISRETGKPRFEALSGEILPALDLIQYFARNTEKVLKREGIRLGKWGLLRRESWCEFPPLGVIGIISPWNFPLSIPLGQIVMALMAGNCVVHKPSEYTPYVGLKIQEIFTEAGLPAGVLTTATGDGTTGEALVRSGVKKIIFTGSVKTGKRIMAAASESLTPVVLELGGKDPMIVLEDADLEGAARGAVWGAFFNSGQVCASVERLYVAAPIAEKFTGLVVEKTKKLRQGIDRADSVEVGSMTNQRQLEIVERHVEDARRRGAKILTGGARKEGEKGYFFEPTVLTGVDHTFPVVKEETFGPVLPIMTFGTENEAVALANDSSYGLTASIWTGDTERGKRLASRLEYGSVMINDNLLTHALPQTPWGGFKESGFGRTHGKYGLLEMVEIRHVHVNKSSIPNGWWYRYSPNKYTAFLSALDLLYGRGILGRAKAFLKVLGNIRLRDTL